MPELVSILIPCHNAERWIAQAIESALAQTWAEKEVIVVDDGSTDRSLEIIRRFEGQIRWESGPNRGGGGARNRLLELAQGSILQYLDADDYLLPQKIAAQMTAWRGCPEADVVYGPATLEHWTARGVRSEILPIPEPRDAWVLLARWYLPQTGALLWRSQSIRDVGGWKPDQPCCQEHELYLRLLMGGKRFAYLEAGGAVYRQWGEHTVCKRDPAETRAQRLAIEKRAEAWLAEHGGLTRERRWAINQARFEMARIAWQTDRAQALRIVATIRRAQPNFLPGGVAAPPAYRWCYRLAGFWLTETIADLRRGFRPPRATG